LTNKQLKKYNFVDTFNIKGVVYSLLIDYTILIYLLSGNGVYATTIYLLSGNGVYATTF